MVPPGLNLDGLGVAVVSIDLIPGLAIIIVVGPAAEIISRPLCGRPSVRYARPLAGVPRHGRAVVPIFRAGRPRRGPGARRDVRDRSSPGRLDEHDADRDR